MDEGQLITSTGDQLLAGWDELMRGDGLRLWPRLSKSVPQASIVLALTCHVHEAARALRPRMPNGLTVLDAPLLRTALEALLTVVWVDRRKDGAAALLNEETRQRRNLRKAMAETDSFAQFANKIQHADDEDLQTSATDEAKWGSSQWRV